MDSFNITLNSPLTEDDWDLITDVDFDRTNEITFHTKHNKEVSFVKLKKGKWKRLIEYVPESDEGLINFDGYQCSVCGGKVWIDDFGFWDYCPNCGAKMEGK